MNKFKNKKLKGGLKKKICNKENTFLRYSSRLIIEETPVSLTPIKEEPLTNETEQFFAVKEETDVEATDIASRNHHNESYTKHSKANKRLDDSKKDNTFQRYSARLIIEEDSTEESAFTRVKEEPHTEETGSQDVEEETDEHSSHNDISLEPSKSALRSLYEGHKVKEEMVIGPEEVQTARPVLSDLNRKSKTIGTPNNISTQKKKRGNDENRDLTCPVCSKTFTLKTNCRRHISTVHKKKKYICNECPQRYSRQDSLKIHKLTHTCKETTMRVNKSYTCENCGKVFNDKSNRNRHRKRCTNDYSTTQKAKTYICDYCNRGIASKHDLIRHIFSHGGFKEYSCSICSKRFTRSHNLKYHMDTHNGKRDNQCKICSKSFTRKWCLVQHMNVHDELRTKCYSCNTCNKQFSFASNLKQHQLFCNKTIFKHKPFSCDICKKRFADKVTLAHHVGSSHLVQFTCDHCKKSFGTKNKLLKHMNLHSDKFSCNICGKTFGSNTSLTQHKLSHSGARSYICELCGKAYIYKSNLCQHKMVVHKGTD